jgi:PAS domain S-box-containing protein
MATEIMPGEHAPDAAVATEQHHDLPVGQDQLLALIDNTNAVIYMRDLDGRYMVVNREYERLFDLRRNEIVGLTDHDLFPKEVADEFRANDLRAAASGKPVHVEEYAPNDDGPRWYITVKFPLLDSAGKPYAVAGISTDITARKQAEEQVRKLNAELEQRVRERTAELETTARELDAFAYSVSHDLRAPLRSLHGFSRFLEEDYSDRLDDDGREYVARIKSSVAKMGQLIDDLLRLSRATRTELNREPVDISALATEIIEELRATEPDRQVGVEVTPGLVATGDSHLLRLALDNLLSNAWKFTGKCENAAITVGTLGQPGDQVFFVRDNGAGFSMRYEAKLFDPLQRLHTAEEFEGNGIGLAIVHRIVSRHGGRIWAESELGKGATFFFTVTSSSPDAEQS